MLGIGLCTNPHQAVSESVLGGLLEGLGLVLNPTKLLATLCWTYYEILVKGGTGPYSRTLPEFELKEGLGIVAKPCQILS